MPDSSHNSFERDALESLVAADLSNKMRGWRKPPPSRRGFVWFIILLLCGAAGFWWWRGAFAPAVPKAPPTLPVPAVPESKTPESDTLIPAGPVYRQLALANYHLPDAHTVIRGDGSAEEDLMLESRKALEQQRYTQALQLLQKLPIAYKVDADYLRAHVYWGQKKYAAAADLFHQLTQSVRYGEAAQWYRALALLCMSDQTEQAKRALRAIANDEGHTFQREAQATLKAM